IRRSLRSYRLSAYRNFQDRREIMKRQFFQLVRYLDAFIDLFELHPQKILVQFAAERRLPVDQAAYKQFDLFRVEFELPATIEQVIDDIVRILVQKGLHQLHLPAFHHQHDHFIRIENDLHAVLRIGGVKHLKALQQQAVIMPVLTGREALLQQLMNVRRDPVHIEQLPPRDLFRQDQAFLQIAVKRVDDLAVILHREQRFRDQAAFGKIVNNERFPNR